jgi:hypothetical protein
MRVGVLHNCPTTRNRLLYNMGREVRAPLAVGCAANLDKLVPWLSHLDRSGCMLRRLLRGCWRSPSLRIVQFPFSITVSVFYRRRNHAASTSSENFLRASEEALYTLAWRVLLVSSLRCPEAAQLLFIFLKIAGAACKEHNSNGRYFL